MSDGSGRRVRELDTLFYESAILAYGFGPIELRANGEELVQYVRNHARAHMHLKALALRAFERVCGTSGYGGDQFVDVGPTVYLAASAGVSSVDALACIVGSIVLGRPFPDENSPSMRSLPKCLQGQKFSALKELITSLNDAAWMTMLVELRNSVIHRGFSAIWRDSDGLWIGQSEGIFREKPPGISSPTDDEIHPESRRSRVELAKIVTGFVDKLEEWENAAMAVLNDAASFRPFVERLRVDVPIRSDALLSQTWEAVYPIGEIDRDYLDWWNDRVSEER